MGEKHTKRYVVAARVGLTAGVNQEFGKDADQRSVEFEQAALVEDGGHGGGCDGLGERCQVEESGGCYVKIPTLRQAQGRLSPKIREKRGTPVIASAAEGFEHDQTIPVRDRDGCGGERMQRDPFADDGEGGGEGLVLPFKGCSQAWKGTVQNVCALEEIPDLCGL